MLPFFITKDFIAASIIIAKNYYYSEDFTSINEINAVGNIIQQKFKSENINVMITDGIDEEYFFNYENVYIKRNDKTIDDLKNRYQEHELPLDAFMILYNKNFMLECIDEARKDMNLLNKVKTKRMKK